MKSATRNCITTRSRVRGFTLIEVMVALVITAIGLLGIAKIQALAYASTGSSGLRSLVASQAASLAASMHANRAYWKASPPATLITQGTITTPSGMDSIANTSTYCVNSAACVPATLAAFDLHTYANALNAPGLLANLNPITTITCVAATPSNCQIQITWNEHAVSINKQSAQNTTQSTFAPTYTLYVEP